MRMPIRVRTDINTDQLYPENSGLPSQPLDKCMSHRVYSQIRHGTYWRVASQGGERSGR